MTDYGLIIERAQVVDGTGNPWLHADVAVTGERIVAVAPPGRLGAAAAAERVDAAGLVLAPGFIDIQSHSIVPFMIDGRALSKIAQGVTTEIMGEGWTPAPFGGRIADPLEPTILPLDMREWDARARTWRRFGDWLDAMVERGVAPNIGSFLGGGTLRSYAKGMELGPPTAAELAVMRRVMAEAMDDGAFGVAYALIYPPDAYTTTGELVEVCRVVAERDGLYITHIRSETEGLIEAVEEALAIGAAAGLPVEIYHLKASGRANWHLVPRLLELINDARASGIDVTADMYPYAASGTGLAAILPPWAAAGGRFYENLRDADTRARIRAATLAPADDWEAMATRNGPENVMPVGFRRDENRPYAGKRLCEIAAMRGQDWVDAAMDLLASEEQQINTIFFSMSEENVARQLREHWIKISSDAGGLDPAWAAAPGPCHPRAYGTFPRVLGKYVREEGVLPLEEAVRKMTSAVAHRLRLRDRGVIREGAYADLVLFNPDEIRDRATFADPHRLSEGVRHVWVNGSRVLRDGHHTGALPGRRLGPG